MQKRYELLCNGIAFVFLVVLLLLPTKILLAEESSLTGESFSDPDYVVPMAKGWEERAIKYEDDLKKADLVVNLDQSEHPLLAPIIKKYAADHGLNIFVISGTCGVSNRNLLSKSIDIGAFCCPPGVEDRLPGLQFYTVGITPLALIVHPDNSIEDVSFGEAQKLFSGEIQRWSELNNAKTMKSLPQVVQPITFIHCKNRPGHWRLLLNDEELFSVGIRNVTDIPAMIYHVGIDKNAIGYETLWLAQEYYKNKGAVKSIKINGIDPEQTDFLLRNQYPLYRTYNLATWSDKDLRKPEAQKLIQYLLEYINTNGSKYHIVSAQKLRQAGWKFKGNELIGAPK